MPWDFFKDQQYVTILGQLKVQTNKEIPLTVMSQVLRVIATQQWGCNSKQNSSTWVSWYFKGDLSHNACKCDHNWYDKIFQIMWNTVIEYRLVRAYLVEGGSNIDTFFLINQILRMIFMISRFTCLKKTQKLKKNVSTWFIHKYGKYEEL